MKRTIIIAGMLALLALASLALGQKNGKSGGVEQTLMQTEQELLDAVLHNDSAKFDRTLAQTYTFTAPDGTTQNKTEFMADLKSGALKMESSKNDEMKVQVYGNTAVVTYRSTDKGNYKGNDISGQYRWTDVFVKQQGRWQIVSTQGTRIAQP